MTSAWMRPCCRYRTPMGSPCNSSTRPGPSWARALRSTSCKKCRAPRTWGWRSSTTPQATLSRSPAPTRRRPPRAIATATTPARWACPTCCSATPTRWARPRSSNTTPVPSCANSAMARFLRSNPPSSASPPPMVPTPPSPTTPSRRSRPPMSPTPVAS